MIEFLSTRSKNKDIRKDGAPIKLSIPSLNRLPYGFTVKDYSGESSKNIVLQLDDLDDIDKIRNIEDEILESLSEHSKDFLKTFMTKDEISEIFNSNLSESGLLRLKVTGDTRLYDENSKPIHSTVVDGLFKDYDAKCNFIISGVYFMNKRIGLIIKAHHIKLYKPTIESGKCMIVLPDD